MIIEDFYVNKDDMVTPENAMDYIYTLEMEQAAEEMDVFMGVQYNTALLCRVWPATDTVQ